MISTVDVMYVLSSLKERKVYFHASPLGRHAQIFANPGLAGFPAVHLGYFKTSPSTTRQVITSFENAHRCQGMTNPGNHIHQICVRELPKNCDKDCMRGFASGVCRYRLHSKTSLAAPPDTSAVTWTMRT